MHEGVKNPNHTLSEKDVLDIKEFKKYHGYRKELAFLYKVNPQTISKIRNNSIWKHIKGDKI